MKQENKKLETIKKVKIMIMALYAILTFIMASNAYDILYGDISQLNMVFKVIIMVIVVYTCVLGIKAWKIINNLEKKQEDE